MNRPESRPDREKRRCVLGGKSTRLNIELTGERPPASPPVQATSWKFGLTLSGNLQRLRRGGKALPVGNWTVNHGLNLSAIWVMREASARPPMFT